MEKPSQFLKEIKIDNSKLFWICCSSSSGVLGFDWQTSSLNQLHKKKSFWVRSELHGGHSAVPPCSTHWPK